MRKRAGGTVVNVIIGVFLIYLCVSAAYFYIRSLDRGASTTTSGAVMTSAASNTTNISSQVADNFSLAQLQTLSFANSSKCDGLLDSKYWDTAIQTSGNITVHMIPNTVYGLTQSWSGWTDFFRNNMTNPPAWLSLGLGNYTSSLEAELAAKAMGTNNVTLAAAVMKNYTAEVGALEAVGVDTLTWGGLSALKVHYQTGSWSEAAAQTFPAQMYQLFQLSQDCSYSEQQRAQFLGTALSMTALVAATSGKDGFGQQFQDMLIRLGIRDAWSNVKGSLKVINDASPAAAYKTTIILGALAKKFPANFKALGSFTASRISIMVQALKEKGFTADEIEQKVAELDQAIAESDDGWHVAEVADAISYQQEGFLRVKIDSDRTASLSTSGSPSRAVTASFLASVLPGFQPGEVTALKVTVHKLWMQLPSYHVYQGGVHLEFSLPKGEVQPGDEVGLSFELLPVEDFAKSIPDFTLTNTGHLQWLSDAAVLKDFRVTGGVMKFEVLQNDAWTSVGSYYIEGRVVNYPGVSSSSSSIYADIAIKDYAGRERSFRIRYDGFSSASLAIDQGPSYSSVATLLYDGFRLSIADIQNEVATIYTSPPSESIYKLDPPHPYSGSYLKLVEGKYTSAYQIDKVELVRDLEESMLSDGGTYDRGRLGAEIAYVVSDEYLGLKNIIIEELSKGGRDLYTQDNSVAIQARFLKNLGANPEKTIQNTLLDLATKLQQDYKNQDQMRDGYAILSYVDTDGAVKTIVLEVPKW